MPRFTSAPSACATTECDAYGHQPCQLPALHARSRDGRFGGGGLRRRPLRGVGAAVVRPRDGHQLPAPTALWRYGDRQDVGGGFPARALAPRTKLRHARPAPSSPRRPPTGFSSTRQRRLHLRPAGDDRRFLPGGCPPTETAASRSLSRRPRRRTCSPYRRASPGATGHCRASTTPTSWPTWRNAACGWRKHLAGLRRAWPQRIRHCRAALPHRVPAACPVRRRADRSDVVSDARRSAPSATTRSPAPATARSLPARVPPGCGLTCDQRPIRIPDEFIAAFAANRALEPDKRDEVSRPCLTPLGPTDAGLAPLSHVVERGQANAARLG